MAFTGAVYAWNGVAVRTRMPAVGETVNGQPFAVPAGAKVVTIHVQALAGGATVKLQTLAPTETVEATQVWDDISVFDLTDGTFIALSALVAETAVTIPVSATGGGYLRLVASADQSGAVTTIPVFFSRDG